jgi:hypothetical protein
LVEEADADALRSAIDRLCNNAGRREQLVCNARRAAAHFRADRVVNQMKRTINRFWTDA